MTVLNLFSLAQVLVVGWGPLEGQASVCCPAVFLHPTDPRLVIFPFVKWDWYHASLRAELGASGTVMGLFQGEGIGLTVFLTGLVAGVCILHQ